MKRFALTLVVMALAVRALVPAGWMPSGERFFALTVCTGIDTQTIWMDSKGGLHKEVPDKDRRSKHDPCAFGGNVDVPQLAETSYSQPTLEAPAPVQPVGHTVHIGQGLAAPPPPQTGPPTLI